MGVGRIVHRCVFAAAIAGLAALALCGSARAIEPRLSAGEGHSLHLRADGTLWAWGANSVGQLGLGDVEDRPVPVQVDSGSDWMQAVSFNDSRSTFALKADGTLWSWGGNEAGQLGLGSAASEYVTTPTQVCASSGNPGPGDAEWTQISAGAFHVVALKGDGSLWAWGLNGSGQLGLGAPDMLAHSLPEQVFLPPGGGSDSDWAAIGCGGSCTFAVKGDGTLWACGRNTDGQLGLGDTSDRSALTQVGSASDWAAAGGGGYFGYGTRTDGRLFTWGSNWAGQLGLGDTLEPDQPDVGRRRLERSPRR